jgi:hypothetical protein
VRLTPEIAWSVVGAPRYFDGPESRDRPKVPEDYAKNVISKQADIRLALKRWFAQSGAPIHPGATMATLRLGDTAPDFTQDSSEGPIRLPPVGRRLLGRASSRTRRLHARVHHRAGQDRGAVGRVRQARREAHRVSVDPARPSTRNWIKDINETQDTTVNFPIIADADRKVATCTT